MITFEKKTLANGLRVLAHTDTTTQMAAVNLLYDVGARDEHPDKTGFAHLFEHLMFGGSRNIPNFDEELQKAGGENNAFTSNDITNYYETLPVQNIETAFWLEADRMRELAFTPKSLDVQRNVVIEEFKQRYLNQPYGDAWLLLRPMAYKVHPYLWATIGKEISHIENAIMDDVKNFFYTHYRPNNAILCVASSLPTAEVFNMAEKWFGNIPSGKKNKRNLPIEPLQQEARRMEVERDVPANAIYITFPMCARSDKKYFTYDLLSDVLSRGESSRLHQILVKEKQLFAEIHAYISGDIDAGLLIISGHIAAGKTVAEAESGIWQVLKETAEKSIDPKELEKVKNKAVSAILFGQISALNKAMHLSYYELLGDAGLLNKEAENYAAVSVDEIAEVAGQLFVPEKSCTLVYHAKNPR